MTVTGGTQASAIFTLVGSILSFLGAGIMLYVLITDKSARAQVRPRMLMVLAGLDSVFALCLFISTIANLVGHEVTAPDFYSQHIWLFLYEIFLFASWNWTCAIAYHIYFVLNTGCEPNSDEEKKKEIFYLKYIFVSIGCFFIPLACVFRFALSDPEAEDDDGGGPNDNVGVQLYRGLQIIYVLRDYLWVIALTILIHVKKFEHYSLAAEQYKLQMRQFLTVFLVLSVQFLVYLMFDETKSRAGPYLTHFGFGFSGYMGMCNAIVWGMSRSCMVTCITKTLKEDDKNSFWINNGRQGSLEMPLLENSFTSQHGSMLSSMRNRKSSISGKWHNIPLDHLRLKEKIGIGAFGVVYRGTYQVMDVAVKEVDRSKWEKQRRSDEGSMGASTMTHLANNELLAEAEILSKMRHPNIVLFYGVAVQYVMAAGKGGSSITSSPGKGSLIRSSSVVNEQIDRYYFVTELCSTSLNKVQLGLHGNDCDSHVLWEVLVQVAAGMQYLHSLNILHRDLKPGNVLVKELVTAGGERQWTFKVCDFGLSKMLDFDAVKERSMTGTIGTPRYMAPEIIVDDKAALKAHPFKCDVYSYSILAWEVLAGRRAFEGREYEHVAGGNIGVMQVMRMIVKGHRPEVPKDDDLTVDQLVESLEKLPQKWPATIVEVLERCWGSRPGDRPDFNWILEKLRECEHEFTQPSSLPTIAETEEDESGRASILSGVGSGL